MMVIRIGINVKFGTIAKYLNKFSVLSMGIILAILMPATTYAATSGYSANDVIGQLTGGVADFTTSGYGSGNQQLNYPSGAVIDTVHHRLIVSDNGNNRVLVYNLNSGNNLLDHTADYVLGQPDFSSTAGNTTQNGLSSPYSGLAYDATNDRLFVADSNNNRVLIYSLSAGISNGMNASYVLGQPNFTSGNSSLSQAGMYSPNGLAFDAIHQSLYVSDGNNIRVLTYNVTPGSITNGMNATHVIGQPDFISNNPLTTQSGLGYPLGVAYNDVTQTLFVADNNSDRVLTYNVAGGVTDGMNASHVLGQPDFTTGNSPNGSPVASTVQSPEAVAIDTQRNVLYIQDDSNNRVVAFDLSGGITDNMNARLVLGQPDFAGSDFSCSAASATNLCDSEGGLAIDPINNRLYVTDSGFNRVLIYNFAHFTTPEGALMAATSGQPYSQTITTTGQQGARSFSRISGSLPPGLTLDPATGVISGTPTQSGTYTFEIAVTDSLGVIGSAYDDPVYTITVSGAGSSSATPPASSPSIKAPNTGFVKKDSTKPITAIAIGVLIIGALLYRSRQRISLR